MIIMGFLKKKIIGNTLKSLLFGVVDATPLAGIVNNIKGDATTAHGKVDFLRLASMLVVVLVVVAVLFFGFSMESAAELLKIAK